MLVGFFRARDAVFEADAFDEGVEDVVNEVAVVADFAVVQAHGLLLGEVFA